MMSCQTDPQIREQLLARFQRELLPPTSWLGRKVLRGTPPAVGYVQEFATVNRDGQPEGIALRLWRITPTSVEALAPESPIPEPGAANGMFYDIAYFSFTLPDASGFGTESSQLGPRYGIGRRYRAITSSGGTEIEDGERLWVS